MQVRWVPYSAGLLAMGALAMLCGAILTPTGDAGQSLTVVEENDARYLLVALMLLLASFCLTLGLPAAYSLLRDDAPRLGLLAVGVFAAGTIAMCGYAVLLIFYRALVRSELLVGPIEAITDDIGIVVFLAIFVGAFYLGELLLAIALWRVPSVARWVPLVLGAHVLTLAVNQLLPASAQNLTTILIAIGLCGIAVSANEAWSQGASITRAGQPV